MTENEVLASCIELLSLMNIYCWRNNTGALKDATGRLIRFGKVGSSDILGVLPDGKFLAVECKKSKGGIVSEYQEEFLQEINNCGGVGLVVRSSEELLNELKKRGYTNDRYRGKIYNK